MFTDLEITKIASAMARHAARRHAVVAENIANADTPGFKAQDLEPFKDAYERVSRAAEAGNHLNSPGARQVEISVFGAASPNGNTVSIEDQMARSAQSARDHETAMTIYSKALSILRTSLGR